MPVSKLIDTGSFAPEVLDVIYKAFDLAWVEIASQAGTDPTAIEFTRNRLAQAVITEAKIDAADAIRLKNAALDTFKLNQRFKE